MYALYQYFDQNILVTWGRISKSASFLQSLCRWCTKRLTARIRPVLHNVIKPDLAAAVSGHVDRLINPEANMCKNTL